MRFILKSENIAGIKVYFKKKYGYISKDYPSSSYVVAYVVDSGQLKEVARGFTKKEAMKNATQNLKDPYEYGKGWRTIEYERL